MKMNETGAEWLRKNDACNDGRKWALAECATLAEVWATARPDWLIWVATRQGILDDRTLWLFSCWCAEQALPHWVAAYSDDRRPQIAIETRRRWIDGQATNEELEAARAAAWAAARDAARDAAQAGAWAGAWAGAAAWEAARDAAWAAARDAARAGAWEAQTKWLRDNATPAFPDAQTSPNLTTSQKEVTCKGDGCADGRAALPGGQGSSGEDGGL